MVLLLVLLVCCSCCCYVLLARMCTFPQFATNITRDTAKSYMPGILLYRRYRKKEPLIR